MNEKYGVKITALVSEFKKKMQELANDTREFGKKAEENATVDFTFKSTGYTKQIEYIKKQMQDIENQKKTAFKFDEKDLEKYNRLKNILKDIEEDISRQKKINIEMNVPDDKSLILKNLYEDREKFTNDLKKLETANIDTSKVEKLEVDYEILGNKLDKLTNKQKEFNGELEETEEKGKKINLGEMFDKSISKIKRFTYYLLGARSVFSLFRKYQSIYFQYNEEMQYQNELAQNSIALALAPAFEFLGNMVAYASIAFAKFIELLTGVNVLSKVSTKGIRDYNKSLKETQTLVSGIDEITNLTLPSGTGLAGQYKALEDFQKKVQEVQKWFDEHPWVQKLAEALGKAFEIAWKVVEWVGKHPDLFLSLLAIGAGVTGAIKITTSLVGLSSVLGSATGVATGTGLAGLTKLLTGLGEFALIAIAIGITVAGTIEIINMIGKIKELKDQVHDMKLGSMEKWPEVFDAITGRLDKTKKGTKEWDTQVGLVKESMKGVVNDIMRGKLKYDEYKTVIDEIKQKLEDLGDDTFTPEIELLTSILGKTANDAVLLNYLKTGQVNLNLNANATWGPNGSASTGKTTTVVNGKATTTTKTTPVSQYKIENTSKVNTNKSTTSSDFVGPKQQTSLGSSAIDLAKKIFGVHAKGLDYVPYDNYPALLHKGETVVPAKYNPTIHSVGNEYTNSLLETMVMKLDDYANRPIELDVDGQKFANATYGYYDNARNRQGYVEGVIR